MLPRFILGPLMVILGLLMFGGIARAATPWALPQLAFGGGWSTTVYLSNTGTNSGTSNLSFYDDQGNPMTAAVNNAAPVSTVSAVLSPGAAAAFEFPNVGPLRQGWISLRLAEGVTGYAVFRQSSPGGQEQEAVVPLAPLGSNAATFAFDNRGLVTTASLVNSSSTVATFNIVLRNAGTTVLGMAQLTLPPRSKTAFVLSALPGLAAGQADYGTVDIVTHKPASLAVLGLRFRNSAITSIPAFHGAISTSQAPLAIPAPVLRGTAVSATSVRLEWASTAANRVRFRVESRPADGSYTEVSQPTASATTLDVQQLRPSSTYSFRIRVETGAGISPYSNEVTVTTLQGILAAPTNLRATATSSSQVSLTWTNNAPDASAVRVESRPVGSSVFMDIGSAATLASAQISNLQPNMAYAFRVRAQSAGGYSAYSNEANATTLPVPKTLFLIHGISQDREDMNGLRESLTGPLGIDQRRFRVDDGFDFSECADATLCNSSCSITSGAQKLARYINNSSPPGDIVLVGFSMGGLIARDMIANNWSGVLDARKVVGLVTLGTPNVGYPYTFADRLLKCTPLILQMDGNWRSKQSQNIVVESEYLFGLNNQWGAGTFPGTNRKWLAASGRSCSNPVRSLDPTTGCRDRNPYSDGVVCDDSATLNLNMSSGSQPSRYWQDPGEIYVHSSGWGSSFVLCGNTGDSTRYPLLSNPPVFGPLFSALRETINGL